MIISLGMRLGKTIEHGIARLFFLLETGVYLELENGQLLEAEK